MWMDRYTYLRGYARLMCCFRVWPSHLSPTCVYCSSCYPSNSGLIWWRIWFIKSQCSSSFIVPCRYQTFALPEDSWFWSGNCCLGSRAYICQIWKGRKLIEHALSPRAVAKPKVDCYSGFCSALGEACRCSCFIFLFWFARIWSWKCYLVANCKPYGIHLQLLSNPSVCWQRHWSWKKMWENLPERFNADPKAPIRKRLVSALVYGILWNWIVSCLFVFRYFFYFFSVDVALRCAREWNTNALSIAVLDCRKLQDLRAL